MQSAAQQREANQLTLDAARRREQELQTFQRIMQDTGGDWERADPLLRQHTPSIYPEYARAIQQERESRFKAMQEETAAELAEAQYGLRSLG
jgi:hypothetical protein